MTVTESDIANIVNDHLTAVISGESTVEDVVASYPDMAELLRTELETAIWLYRQNLTIELPRDLFTFRKDNLLSRLPKRQRVPLHRLGSLAKRVSRYFRPGGLVAILLICLSLTGVVLAAQAALPGDRLYSLKLTVEDWRLRAARDEYRRADVRIWIAETRLDEVEKLVDGGEIEAVDSELGQYAASIQIALTGIEPGGAPDQNKQELALKLEQKLVTHLTRLEALRDRLPESAQSGINRAIMVSTHGLIVAQNAVRGYHLTITPPGKMPTSTATQTSSVTPTRTSTPTSTAKIANTYHPATKTYDQPGNSRPETTKTPPGLLKTPPAHGLDKTKPAVPTHPDPKEDPKPSKTPKS